MFIAFKRDQDTPVVKAEELQYFRQAKELFTEMQRGVEHMQEASRQRMLREQAEAKEKMGTIVHQYESSLTARLDLFESHAAKTLSETYDNELKSFTQQASAYLNACKVEMMDHVIDALRQVAVSEDFTEFVCKAFKAHMGEKHADYSLSQYTKDGQLFLEFENDSQVFSFSVESILAAARERLFLEYQNTDGQHEG